MKNKPQEKGYKIPRAGQERETLREKGQFWTPDWVAEAMVEYVLANGGTSIFDPAVGAGAFFRAAKLFSDETGRAINLFGMEIDPAALQQAEQNGLNQADLAHVKIGDFVFDPPQYRIPAIVANPPYIRHHRLSQSTKAYLKALSVKTIGSTLDGRAGLHVYFLIRALQLLDTAGRLAFIMPADTCEGVFSSQLWRWISENYRLEAVVTFMPDASPFPTVDTNPIIFMIQNAAPQQHFFWVRCNRANGNHLKSWIRSGFTLSDAESLMVWKREIAEGIETGLSRAPLNDQPDDFTLAHFAKVVRGIATGANDFFFLTHKQITKLHLPPHYFISGIGRTRDVPANQVTNKLLEELEAKGRPTLLLYLANTSPDDYPESLRNYLHYGETLGLPTRPLISQRRVWYHVETRQPPPILFAYLGRRNSRFIRNYAQVVPLTSFLCVYPHQNDPDFIEKLWQVLDHPETVANLALIGKSYGAGAVKVEPRALEKLPLPEHLIKRAGLQPARYNYVQRKLI